MSSKNKSDINYHSSVFVSAKHNINYNFLQKNRRINRLRTHSKVKQKNLYKVWSKLSTKENYHGQQHTTHQIPLHFRIKRGPNGKETQYIYRDNYPYIRILPDVGQNVAQFKCIQGLNYCPSKIYHKTTDDVYTYFYTDTHTSSKYSHKKSDPDGLITFDFTEKLKERLDCGDKPGAAFKAQRRDDPEMAAKLRGYQQQFKSKLYYHHKKKYGILPLSRGEFGPYLVRNGLDGNYYAQKILRKDHDPNPPDRLMKQWKDRAGKFYIGDGKTNGRHQHFVCKWGAEILGDMSSISINRISVDLTFKSTPSGSSLLKEPVLYEGCMLLWGGFKNKHPNYVPFSIPLAMSLYSKAKSSHEEYILGLDSLQTAIDEAYDIKIFEHKFDVDIMSDLEPALFSACSEKFEADNTLCGFHYCNAIDINISKKGLSIFTHSNGTMYNVECLYWVRQYKSLLVMSPLYIFSCHNIILDDIKLLIPEAHDAAYLFHDYHGGYYMRPGFVIKWNQYRSEQQTNNDQEKGNGDVNRFVGAHTAIDDWSYGMGKWFNDKHLDFVQYMENGVQNKRHTSEILKNKLLNLVWDYQDKYHKKKHLRIAMKYASIALKGNKDIIQKILKRKVFYDRNT